MYIKNQKLSEIFKGKSIGVIGAGVSHKTLIKQLAGYGYNVTLHDRRSKDELGETAAELLSAGAKLALGSSYLDNLTEQVIFRTPGMRYHTPQLTAARQNGQIVTSELEVFFDIAPCPIFAVTGSDGKTTTTTLIAKFLEASGYNVHLGGNIGRALLPIVDSINPKTDVAVVELSSFQLISMRQSPQVAVLLNVTPNHLDMHADMAEYIDAKRNIYLHQNAFSRTVLGLDNEISASFQNEVRGELLGFSMHTALHRGVYLNEDDIICIKNGAKEQKVLDSRKIILPGRHNISNYIAAITATLGYVAPEIIENIATTFTGVEHRLEFVREVCGARWFNDSIASSPTRAMAALESFPQKIILLAGGYDKKIPFDTLAPKILEKVKVLVLCGATAPAIEKAVRSCPGFEQSSLTIIHAKNMEDAVNITKTLTEKGDIVSLSPACASFDFYKNFEERGRHFKDLVNAI